MPISGGHNTTSPYSFKNRGSYTNVWSSTSYGSNTAYNRLFGEYLDTIKRDEYDNYKDRAMIVRCMKIPPQHSVSGTITNLPNSTINICGQT